MAAGAPAGETPPSRGMLGGVAWMVGFRIFDRVAGVLSILVLARLLLPEHFGVVALASTVVAFVELLGALGLDTVLIQQRELTRAHYDTAWTIQLAVASFCAAMLVLAADPAAGFFKEPRLEAVVYAMAFSMFCEGWQNIRLVDLRREMRFDLEFRFLAARRLVAVLVTMAAAFLLRNEWALAIGIVTSRLTGVAMSYLLRPYRPAFSLAHRAQFLGKSTWLLLGNLVMFARNRSSDIILGRMSGAATVGAYNLGADLANMVGQELVAPINRVALPDFSQKSTREAVAESFDTLTGQVAVFIAPLGAGMAACATVLVPLLFGPAWMQAVDVLRFLAWAAVVAALASNIGVAFISLGHFRANAAIHAIGAVTLVPLLAWGAHVAGATGAAAAVLVGNLITTLAALVYSVRAFDYGIIRFIRRVWRPVTAAALMSYLVAHAGDFMADWWAHLSDWSHLALMIAIGGVSYPALLLGLWGLSGFPGGAERVTLGLLDRLVWQRIRPGLRRLVG